jgi:hypothetical protein
MFVKEESRVKRTRDTRGIYRPSFDLKALTDSLLATLHRLDVGYLKG